MPQCLQTDQTSLGFDPSCMNTELSNRRIDGPLIRLWFCDQGKSHRAGGAALIQATALLSCQTVRMRWWLSNKHKPHKHCLCTAKIIHYSWFISWGAYVSIKQILYIQTDSVWGCCGYAGLCTACLAATVKEEDDAYRGKEKKQKTVTIFTANTMNSVDIVLSIYCITPHTNERIKSFTDMYVMPFGSSYSLNLWPVMTKQTCK